MTQSSRTFSDCAVWSNFLFLAPLALALGVGLYTYAGVIVVATYFSIMYHHAHEKGYARIDRSAAYTLIVANAVLCVRGGLATWYVVALIAASVMAIYFRNRELKAPSGYAFNHALWHAFCACVTLFSILIYLERV